MERKLAAIFYADVAGYSRLTGADEEGTHRTLRAFLDSLSASIKTHGGRVVHYAGDAILADFPSVIDALTCATAAQREFKSRNDLLIDDHKLQFRIGINLGDVIIDGEEIYGDGVNVAARLEGLADAGGICISRAVYDQVKGKVNLGFEFMGEREVKNIAEPVRAYRVLLDGAAEPKADDAPQPARPVTGKKKAGKTLATAGVLLLLVAGAGLWWTGREAPPPAPEAARPMPSGEKPSIAVLPFANMSGEKEQEYFSDGMTEDLITDLSKISGLMVIARNTSFTYKGRAVNVPEVARELGVRYVLEGSVRASGGRVRINAQLIDARTGGHLWAERFDRELGDIFTLQDDVTEKIVSALAVKLTKGEKELLHRIDRNTTPETYDVYLRGSEALHRFTPEGIEESRAYFLKAIAMDPSYARPYAALGFTYTVSALFIRAEDQKEMIRQSLKYAQKAIELDDTLPQGHFSMAVAFLRQGRHMDALASARQSVRHDPNYADGFAQIANILAFIGEGAEAKRVIQKAMTLNPHYSAAYVEVLSRAHYVMGEYDPAAKLLRECISRDPAYLICRMMLASTYGLSGKIDAAKWEVEEARNLMPGFSSRWREMASQFMKAEDKQRYVSGLRIAGASEKPGPAGDSEKPSIAVLPFANMSDDKQQEYFSDGITEDLITDLSKVSGLMVIARNSTFAYKGKSVDVRQVAKELGVRYVLEGSVRKSGRQVRINAQLIDAATGGHLWADRYDGSLEDVFALQDKVTAKIVASLSIQLTEPEQRRLAQKGTKNVEAYDFYLRGLAQETKFTRRDIAEAIRFYEQAIALDADYSDAYARMANLYQLTAQFGGTDDKTGAMAKAVALAEKAIVLDEQNPFAHWTLGRILSRRSMAQYGGYERGLEAMERAIALEPNYAAAYAFLTFYYAGVGRFEDARRTIETAIRLNPRHPFWYHLAVGATHFYASDFDAAITSLEKALERNPRAIFVRWWLAAAYALAGRQDDAEWQVEELEAMEVRVTVEDIIDQTTVHGPAQLKLFTEGLLKAGFKRRRPSAPAKPEKPSIAVLPFTNMSGDAEQEYFSDGMTEDLITDLSKISGLLVIARNSTFAYKGKSPDVRQVAKELGVRYVLEGSVRKAGNRVRINAQLIDAATGGHVWADRYDGTLEDVFALQDKVTAKIVATLAVQLAAGEQERIVRKETENTEAYDTFLKGWEQYLRQRPESFRQAIALFKKAAKLDSKYSRAYAALSATYWQIWKRTWHGKLGWASIHEPQFRAEKYLEKAMREPTALALQVAASMYSHQGRHDAAITEGERAIALDPNDADGYVTLAGVLSLAGQFEKALGLIERAMRLNPHYPPSYLYELGLARFGMEQFSEAAGTLEKATALNPDDRWPLRLLLAVYGHLGRGEDAAKIFEAAEKNWRGIDPLSVRGVAFWYPFKQPVDAERLAEGLRRANVPD